MPQPLSVSRTNPNHFSMSSLLLGGFFLAFTLLYTASAWAGPFTQNGTQPPTTFGITASTSCKSCHGTYDGTNNIEPWDTWAGSMMAQATRDPIFWAALDVANNDVPDIGDFCLRCHSPRGWLAGRSEPPGGNANGCGLVGTIDVAGQDFDGVSCHLCHRMMENPSPPGGQQSVYTENGQYWIDDVVCASGGTEPCRRGPYDYPADGASLPPHPWAFSTYIESAVLCGNCHNVTSPIETLIVNGASTGVPFPIERTFREWQMSVYADSLSGEFKNCQACHMPDATMNPAYACLISPNNHANDLPIHQLAGGNAWIPEVLRLEYPNLNLNTNFTATQNWALDMLQNQSATVLVTAPDTLSSGNLLVDVKVTNNTGHKLPTGYPEGRRMWINLRARNGQGALIWESAAYDSITGALTQDAQAKVYIAEQGIWNLNNTNACDCDSASSPIFHFVRNNCIKLDNRIPPKGFMGMNDEETKPRGYSYPETFNGSGVLVNYDITTYSIPIPPQTIPPVTVTATLKYQTASDDYVTFLNDQAVTYNFPDDCIPRTAGAPTQSRGEILYEMWTDHGRCPPVDMATGSDVSAIGATGVASPTLPAAIRLVARSGPTEATQRVSFDLPERSRVSLVVYDVAGRLVARLIDSVRPAGAHTAEWDAAAQPSGIYFYRLEAGGTVRTARTFIVR